MKNECRRQAEKVRRRGMVAARSNRATAVHCPLRPMRPMFGTMKRAALILVFGLLAASPSFASFRCGTKIVTEGDTRSEGGREVRRARRRRQPEQRVPPPGDLDAWPAVLHRRETTSRFPVETWVYNFGPNKLMRTLRFEGGVVSRSRRSATATGLMRSSDAELAPDCGTGD